jgi:hypothetical protein
VVRDDKLFSKGGGILKKNLNVRISEEQWLFINNPRFRSKSEVVRKALEMWIRSVSEVALMDRSLCINCFDVTFQDAMGDCVKCGEPSDDLTMEK